MKTFLQAAGIFLVFVIGMLIIAGQLSSSVSNTELENTLEMSLEHALYVAMSENSYTINDQDELAADVIHELFSSCDIKADYTIAFNVIDLENGLVDVQVTQIMENEFIPLIKSEVVCRKTILLDVETA